MTWLRRVTTMLVASAIPLFGAVRPAYATTTVTVEGTVVTITIAVSVPDVTMRDSTGRRMPMSEYVEQAGEAIWNAALSGLRYRDCLTFHLDVDAVGVGADGFARDGDHRIGYNGSPTFRSFVNVPLVEGDSGRSEEDHRGPYDESADGTWGPIDEGTVAHELGHLLGLGDDYRDVGGTYRDVHSIPAPGREGTLMAGGDRIDQALVDRLGALIEQGEDLPECNWTGTLQGSWTTETEQCRGSSFEGEVRLSIDAAGVAGSIDVTESVDCLGFPSEPYSGLAELDGTFFEEEIEMSVVGLNGGVNVWGCFLAGIPVIQVGTQDTVSAEWTASAPPDSTYKCHLTLQRVGPSS